MIGVRGALPFLVFYRKMGMGNVGRSETTRGEWACPPPRAVGTEMSLAPMVDARDLGYRIVILASSPLGFGVYRRIGFREYFSWTIYEVG